MWIQCWEVGGDGAGRVVGNAVVNSLSASARPFGVLSESSGKPRTDQIVGR